MSSMQDKCRFLEEVCAVFDYAYPVQWARCIQQKTGVFPIGLVWLYDAEARMCGRPFPVTLYAWQLMNIAGVKVRPYRNP